MDPDPIYLKDSTLQSEKTLKPLYKMSKIFKFLAIIIDTPPIIIHLPNMPSLPAVFMCVRDAVLLVGWFMVVWTSDAIPTGDTLVPRALYWHGILPSLQSQEGSESQWWLSRAYFT